MKNITDILKGIGLEIPEDKVETFNQTFNENYKTVNEVNTANIKLNDLQEKYNTDIQSRDNDLAGLKQKLAEAGTDKTKLEDITNQFNSLQANYETQKNEYEKKLASQQYEFLVREKSNELKFTSNGAKKAFTTDLLAKNLPVENGTLLGFDDYVKTYKESDAGAFVQDTPTPDTKPKPVLSGKANPTPNPTPEQKDVPKVW